MNNNKLIAQAEEYIEWAEDNIYEVPITLPDVLRELVDKVKEQEQIIKNYSNN